MALSKAITIGKTPRYSTKREGSLGGSDARLEASGLRQGKCGGTTKFLQLREDSHTDHLSDRCRDRSSSCNSSTTRTAEELEETEASELASITMVGMKMYSGIILFV